MSNPSNAQALIATPVFSDELGLLMFKPDQAALQAFRALLDKSPVLLARAPEELAAGGTGLVTRKRKVSPLPVDAVLFFASQSEVFKALGGAAQFTGWQGRGEQCVIEGDDCTGGFTWSSDAQPVSLCWHHDNEHREKPVPEVLEKIKHRLVAFALSRVSAFVGRGYGVDVSAAELSWWAASHEVHDLLPSSLALMALGRKAKPTERQTALGWRDTDARYTQRDHVADLTEKVKAIKFEVDPEPAASFMARPKLSRWESAAYLKFVRSQPCVVTGATEGVEAHHVIGHGQSGMAMKTHDLMAFPLCHDSHMKLHDGGWQQWERQHGSQLAHVMATINKAAGLGVFG
ncbi:MAG: DUF968 domain-containing protein [Oceanisphaera sp.]|uniref:DUF968 domain-containing protein n=1 Tax=Oceanisphaera sp. TaxID=1929979 RepID=UPI003C7444FC